jgi:hypothetical protein
MTKKTKNKSKKKIVRTSSLKSAKNFAVKPAKNTPEYYLCMGECCKGKNITQVARQCKNNAPSLVAKRKKKIHELAKAAKVIGKFAQDLEQVLRH